MKKLLFILILLIPFIVYAEYDESKVTIKSFTKVATTGYGEELSSPTITDDGIKFNIKVSNKDDSVTYELVIKNESGEDIEVYNRIEKDDYIKYTLNTSDLDYVVKNGEEKTFVISALYDNLIEETKLSSGNYNNTHVYSLKVSNELGQEDSVMALADVTHDAVAPTGTVDNPKTLSVKNVLLVVCIIFVISLGLFLIIRRKNRLGKLFIFIGIIGIITPIIVYAYKTYNLSLEAKVTITEPILPICKRATVLHQDECNMTAYFSCKTLGYTLDGDKHTTTIIYGDLGTAGILTSGDAFDCDVNGDGNYDPDTERFYYLKTYDNYASLIYYNNTVNGLPDSTTTVAYYSPGKNYLGPIDAVKHLPTTTQWSKVQLSNTERSIVTETGGKRTATGTLPATFSYAGYSARLPILQDIIGVCIDSYEDDDYFSIDTCDYLLESTKFVNANNAEGYWLENPTSNKNQCMFSISNAAHIAGYNGCSYPNNNSTSGVRPVIEVPLNKIEY